MEIHVLLLEKVGEIVYLAIVSHELDPMPRIDSGGAEITSFYTHFYTCCLCCLTALQRERFYFDVRVVAPNVSKNIRMLPRLIPPYNFSTEYAIFFLTSVPTLAYNDR